MRLKHYLRWRAFGRNAAPVALPLLGLDTELPPDWGFHADEDRILAEKIAAMPALTREVFLLRAVDRMSFDEISEHLAIARWCVKSHLRRAITRLAARNDI